MAVYVISYCPLRENAQGCTGGCRAQAWISLLPSFVPVPVSKSQGLRVGGGNDEADGWGSKLLPSAVCQLPALSIVLLQRIAITSGDQALVGTDPTAKTHLGSGNPVALCPLPSKLVDAASTYSGHRVRRSQHKGDTLDSAPISILT